jgi:FkbM family methyltransferase
MQFLRKWIPIPRIKPINTFHSRLVGKFQNILGAITTTIFKKFLVMGSQLGLSGARLVGSFENGNVEVILNKDCPLGKKGSTIQLPRDEVIFKNILRDGSWELEECIFLADGIKAIASTENSRIAFVDIGANTGLVSLQVANRLSMELNYVLFEPIPRHFQAIQHNLKHLSKTHLFNAGLAANGGRAEIFTQSDNHGNSSILQSAIPSMGPGETISTVVEMLNTQEICVWLDSHYDSIVIKSDTQGMDALILSEFSDEIWRKVQCAVIEVWALEEVDELNVSELLCKLEKTHRMSWGPGGDEVESDNVGKFWINKNGQSRNLFLERLAL